jgi:hypothetical protein
VHYQGRLKVTWPEYKRGNFKSYRLTVSYFDTTGLYSTSLNRVITNPKQNNYIDSSYVGGSVTYSVTVTNQNNQTGEGHKTYTENNSILKFERLNDGSVKAYWNKSVFYNNFIKYGFWKGDNLMETVYNKSITDTTRVFTPQFGSPELIRVF